MPYINDFESLLLARRAVVMSPNEEAEALYDQVLASVDPQVLAQFDDQQRFLTMSFEEERKILPRKDHFNISTLSKGKNYDGAPIGIAYEEVGPQKEPGAGDQVQLMYKNLPTPGDKPSLLRGEFPFIGFKAQKVNDDAGFDTGNVLMSPMLDVPPDFAIAYGLKMPFDNIDDALNVWSQQFVSALKDTPDADLTEKEIALKKTLQLATDGATVHNSQVIDLRTQLPGGGVSAAELYDLAGGQETTERAPMRFPKMAPDGMPLPEPRMVENSLTRGGFSGSMPTGEIGFFGRMYNHTVNSLTKIARHIPIYTGMVPPQAYDAAVEYANQEKIPPPKLTTEITQDMIDRYRTQLKLAARAGKIKESVEDVVAIPDDKLKEVIEGFQGLVDDWETERRQKAPDFVADLAVTALATGPLSSPIKAGLRGASWYARMVSAANESAFKLWALRSATGIAAENIVGTPVYAAMTSQKEDALDLALDFGVGAALDLGVRAAGVGLRRAYYSHGFKERAIAGFDKMFDSVPLADKSRFFDELYEDTFKPQYIWGGKAEYNKAAARSIGGTPDVVGTQADPFGGVLTANEVEGVTASPVVQMNTTITGITGGQKLERALTIELGVDVPSTKIVDVKPGVNKRLVAAWDAYAKKTGNLSWEETVREVKNVAMGGKLVEGDVIKRTKAALRDVRDRVRSDLLRLKNRVNEQRAAILAEIKNKKIEIATTKAGKITTETRARAELLDIAARNTDEILEIERQGAINEIAFKNNIQAEEIPLWIERGKKRIELANARRAAAAAKRRIDNPTSSKKNAEKSYRQRVTEADSFARNVRRIEAELSKIESQFKSPVSSREANKIQRTLTEDMNRVDAEIESRRTQGRLARVDIGQDMPEEFTFLTNAHKKAATLDTNYWANYAEIEAQLNQASKWADEALAEASGALSRLRREQIDFFKRISDEAELHARSGIVRGLDEGFGGEDRLRAVIHDARKAANGDLRKLADIDPEEAKSIAIPSKMAAEFRRNLSWLGLHDTATGPNAISIKQVAQMLFNLDAAPDRMSDLTVGQTNALKSVMERFNRKVTREFNDAKNALQIHLAFDDRFMQMYENYKAFRDAVAEERAAAREEGRAFDRANITVPEVTKAQVDKYVFQFFDDSGMNGETIGMNDIVHRRMVEEKSVISRLYEADTRSSVSSLLSTERNRDIVYRFLKKNLPSWVEPDTLPEWLAKSRRTGLSRSELSNFDPRKWAQGLSRHGIFHAMEAVQEYMGIHGILSEDFVRSAREARYKISRFIENYGGILARFGDRMPGAIDDLLQKASSLAGYTDINMRKLVGKIQHERYLKTLTEEQLLEFGGRNKVMEFTVAIDSELEALGMSRADFRSAIEIVDSYFKDMHEVVQSLTNKKMGEINIGFIPMRELINPNNNVISRELKGSLLNDYDMRFVNKRVLDSEVASLEFDVLELANGYFSRTMYTTQANEMITNARKLALATQLMSGKDSYLSRMMLGQSGDDGILGHIVGHTLMRPPAGSATGAHRFFERVLKLANPRGWGQKFNMLTVVNVPNIMYQNVEGYASVGSAMGFMSGIHTFGNQIAQIPGVDAMVGSLMGAPRSKIQMARRILAESGTDGENLLSIARHDFLAENARKTDLLQATFRYQPGGLDRAYNIAMSPFTKVDQAVRVGAFIEADRRLRNAFNSPKVKAAVARGDMEEAWRIGASKSGIGVRSGGVNQGVRLEMKSLFMERGLDAIDDLSVKYGIGVNTRLLVDYGPGGRGAFFRSELGRTTTPFASYYIGRAQFFSEAVDAWLTFAGDLRGEPIYAQAGKLLTGEPARKLMLIGLFELSAFGLKTTTGIVSSPYGIFPALASIYTSGMSTAGGLFNADFRDSEILGKGRRLAPNVELLGNAIGAGVLLTGWGIGHAAAMLGSLRDDVSLEKMAEDSEVMTAAVELVSKTIGKIDWYAKSHGEELDDNLKSVTMELMELDRKTARSLGSRLGRAERQVLFAYGMFRSAYNAAQMYALGDKDMTAFNRITRVLLTPGLERSEFSAAIAKDMVIDMGDNPNFALQLAQGYKSVNASFFSSLTSVDQLFRERGSTYGFISMFGKLMDLKYASGTDPNLILKRETEDRAAIEGLALRSKLYSVSLEDYVEENLDSINEAVVAQGKAPFPSAIEAIKDTISTYHFDANVTPRHYNVTVDDSLARFIAGVTSVSPGFGKNEALIAILGMEGAGLDTTGDVGNKAAGGSSHGFVQMSMDNLRSIWNRADRIPSVKAGYDSFDEWHAAFRKDPELQGVVVGDFFNEDMSKRLEKLGLDPDDTSSLKNVFALQWTWMQGAPRDGKLYVPDDARALEGRLRNFVAAMIRAERLGEFLDEVDDVPMTGDAREMLNGVIESSGGL